MCANAIAHNPHQLKHENRDSNECQIDRRRQCSLNTENIMILSVCLTINFVRSNLSTNFYCKMRELHRLRVSSIAHCVRFAPCRPKWNQTTNKITNNRRWKENSKRTMEKQREENVKSKRSKWFDSSLANVWKRNKQIYSKQEWNHFSSAKQKEEEEEEEKKLMQKSNWK